MIVKDNECFNLEVGTKVKVIDFTLYIKASELGIDAKDETFKRYINKHLNYVGTLTKVNKDTGSIFIDKTIWFLLDELSSLILEVLDE